MRIQPGAVKIVFFFLLFWLFLPCFMFAGGSREQESLEKLRQAEKLFEEKKYNESIILLTEVARSDPDKFDAVEKIMQKIRSIRTEYNSVHEELIDTLFVDYDPKRALELIDIMQEMDPNPNEATVRSLAQAKAGTELIYFLNLFNEIMDASLAMLERGEFINAVDNYLRGYTIHRENFDKADYGNIIKNSVENSLNTVKHESSEFKLLSARLSKTGENLKKSYQIENMLESIFSDLNELLFIKSGVENAALNFRAQNRQIKKTSAEGKYDLFLHFAGQLALGRPKAGVREGIVSTMELMWESEAPEINAQIVQTGDNFYSMGLNSFRNKDYKSAQSSFQMANSVYFTALDIQAMWAANLKLSPHYILDERSQSIVQNQLPPLLRIQEKLKEVRDYQVLINTASSIDELFKEDRAITDQFIAARDQVSEYKHNMDNGKRVWQDEIRRYQEISLIGYDVSEHEKQAEVMISEFDSYIIFLENTDVNFLKSIIKLEMQGWPENFEASSKKYEEGHIFQEGIEVALELIKDSDGNVIETPSRIEKYPDRALAIFEPLVEDLSQLSNLIEVQLPRGLSDQDYLLKAADLQEQLKSVGDLKNDVESLLAELDQRIQKARNDVLQAERFKREGNLRFQKAEADIARERFEHARDNIEGAGVAFGRSLSFKEDAELRSTWDKRLTALSNQIVEAENQKVVREVRVLITRARRLYDHNEFIGAEQAMLKARSRWADTNNEENEEIIDWLIIFRRALEANTGREITETDPLFTEMSQLYNLATEDYIAARELLEQGREREALERLRRAEVKLEQIKYSFPYNREARNLSLKIAQLEDQEGFSKRLTALYNEAVQKIDTNPKDAYVDLKDLEEFKPDYPGLRNKLYALEIKLGMRILPTDPAKIAQSRELTEQARQIVVKAERDLYPVALEQLNRAIELDPNNRQAINYKDRIQIDMGGTRQAVLSSDADRQYREAEEKFLEGNYFEALVIVDRLLRDPNNKKYRPLLDLKNRIDTKI